MCLPSSGVPPLWVPRERLVTGPAHALRFLSMSGGPGAVPSEEQQPPGRERGAPGVTQGEHVLWGAGVKFAVAEVLPDETESREEGRLEDKECCW